MLYNFKNAIQIVYFSVLIILNGIVKKKGIVSSYTMYLFIRLMWSNTLTQEKNNNSLLPHGWNELLICRPPCTGSH